ncbi:MAG: hypothetical protein H0V89_12070 [Deltaproteobacteria bacterium]|nr:hypothetical protein [Deltaproteobacteria bacterium]
MKSVCLRCGAIRGSFDGICSSCGHRPDGEGLLVAWLLSSENLDPAELQRTSERVARGESIRPSARQLDRARRALGRHFTVDPGLSTRDRILLLACSLLLTPLPGLVYAASWRTERPRAALEAFALSAPASVLAFVAVVWGVAGR